MLTHSQRYPEQWEADVVLRDGGTAHVRPIRPDDSDRLVAFYATLSNEAKYFRFFAPYPRLSHRDVERFTTVDHIDRVALVALIGDDMVGIVQYDRTDEAGRSAVGPQSRQAEVAFLVGDAHQGRGLASVLLEHLAAAARERGITRFVADVLPANQKMIGVFHDAGYSQTTGYEHGVLHLTIDLAPTETSLEVMRAREHRAEARSVARLLRSRSVAVVGASRASANVGQTILRNVMAGGFAGPIFAVNRQASMGNRATVAGAPMVRSVLDIPGAVDLAVVAVPASEVSAVVEDCAAKGVLGLVVVSSGFAETGPDGRQRQRALVRLARANGMRVLGPNSFGLANTDPDVSLNASLSPALPGRGPIGLFSQSGALGVAILESAARRGLGLSTFVSAGNRADVSGNDLLQYWDEDPATGIVLLYLESIGNPRKFSRLARRITRHKPIVAVKAGRFTQGAPVGHAVRATSAPARALDAMFRQSGVIQVDTTAELFDVAQVLAVQPLPRGRRVAVVGNSDALRLHAVDACARAGLSLAGAPIAVGPDAGAGEFGAALGGALEDPGADAVVIVYVKSFAAAGEEVSRRVAREISRQTQERQTQDRQTQDTEKTVVATFLGQEGVPNLLRRPGAAGLPAVGSVPSYRSPEEAVRALTAVIDYAEWRARPAGEIPELPGIAAKDARERIVDAMVAAPDGTRLAREQVTELLGSYGVAVLPAMAVTSVDEAVAAAGRLGFPVVLKTLSPAFRHRADLGGVRLNIDTPEALRSAFAGIVRDLGPAAVANLVVAPMARPGLACVVDTAEDPLFGPLVSVGVAGVAIELLDDRAFGIPPLTDADVRGMVRSIKAAPMLFGHRGADPVDVAALEDLLLRVAALADDCPEIAELTLNPIIVSDIGHGCTVVDAEMRLAPPAVRTDFGPRRMSG